MTDPNLAKNPYLDLETDVVEHLASLTPDTPEMRRVGKQEWLRLALTDAMIAARKTAGMTQQEVAEALGVSQSWVSKLESVNYDHQVESIVAHLDAVGAELLMAIKVGDELIPVKRENTDRVLVDVPVQYQSEAERQRYGRQRSSSTPSDEDYSWESGVTRLDMDYLASSYRYSPPADLPVIYDSYGYGKIDQKYQKTV